MPSYQLLCWEEIPAQIKVTDGAEELNLELPARFQEKIDAVAAERGKGDTDAYLAGWKWSDPVECSGTPAEISAAVQREIEAKFSA
jgi:Virulence factor